MYIQKPSTCLPSISLSNGSLLFFIVAKEELMKKTITLNFEKHSSGFTQKLLFLLMLLVNKKIILK